MPKKTKRQLKEESKEVRSDHKVYFPLDNEQIQVRQDILKNDITVLIGKAGSGKTAVACYTALKMLLDGEVEKIIVCRPMISNEEMGYLRGRLEEKYLPWCIPMIQNFNKMCNPKTIEYLMSKGIIEMLPLQFTRGVTYDNACMILDESQNTTPQQLKMVMSRIGKESKIIITGDCDQIDLKKNSDSGLLKIKDFNLPNFAVIELQNEHRKQIVIDILKAFKEIGY
jgi:phosphate starvation-inducible PhoH-like protein